MARNDIVLLDSILEKYKTQLLGRNDSEVFELFCFDQILKDFDLSYEELETGWTDGGDDGGVDGFFTFVNDHLVTDSDLAFASKRNPEVRLEIFTVKRSDTFKLEPLNSLYSSITELLDFTKTEDQFSYPFREEVVEQRRLLKNAIVSLADRRPHLTIRINYCSRGDIQSLANNLIQRAETIRQLVVELFGEAQVEVNFYGASELLSIARRVQTYSLRLKFLETYISREGANYLVLVSLPDYFTFVCDENGNLRRYLFDSNVRDYLGLSQINEDIRKTLDLRRDSADEDFWWLNNGITLLATYANVVGKDISLENVQIVNGLQTTETIYNFYKDVGVFDDRRAVLVKILLAADEQARARIIKATNYQNSVDLTSLRGLDTIQRDIEDYLFDNGWYYDRRKNYYKNQGRPAERIISIAYLAAAVRAIALRDPARSQRQRARSLRNESEYHQVFNPDWQLNVYLASLEITHAVEMVIQSKRRLANTPPIALVHYIGYVYACDQLGQSTYEPHEVVALVGHPPSTETVLSIRNDLKNASYERSGRKYDGIIVSRRFIEDFILSRFGVSVPTRHRLSLRSEGRLSRAKQKKMLDMLDEVAQDNYPDPSTAIASDAYTFLSDIVQGLRSQDRPGGMRKLLVEVASENGNDPVKTEKILATIFQLQTKIRNGTPLSEGEIRNFLRAISTIVEYVGLDSI